MTKLCWLGAVAVLGCAGPVPAQEVVPAGKGSYASSPPAEAGKGAMEMIGTKLSLVPGASPTDRPVPTNQNWTYLLKGKLGAELWYYPWRVDTKDAGKKDAGIDVYCPTDWGTKGNDPQCDHPVKIVGIDFKTPSLAVKQWGDWTLSYRLAASAEQYLDVTTGQGMPFVWVETHDVALSIDLDSGARFTDAKGRALTFPMTGEELTVSSAGRFYGVFVPRGTQFEEAKGQLNLKMAPGRSYLVLAAMKDAKDLSLFAKYARNIPRDSRMEWNYAPTTGLVQTTWTVTTESLDGPGAGTGDVMQGWLPHHYRGGACAFKMDGPEYLTPRGPMKLATGNKFRINYRFDGFLPVLPAPVKRGGEHDFDASRMSGYLKAVADKDKYGDDSYWGGKDLLRYSTHMLMAKLLKDPSYGRLKEEAHTALADWYTYTPGEKAHYFARYENWHALVGMKGSYDSEKFNDQHFHYGYFTNAAAMLAMEDPDFLKEYGDMARLVAKEYANCDRSDTRYPFLRTFDIWAGHSWAGGLGSPGGNNQESSSEAMQSWAGLYLLGTMLNDPDMTATGAMGYAMESKAVMEYWFNIHGDLLPAKYHHPTVGILWSGGNAWGTYFSGEPGWIFGIQCLPVTPALEYLVRDPAFAQKSFHTILELQKAGKGSDDPGTMGDLGNVLLAHASKFEPQWVAQKMDQLWDENNAIARKHNDAGTIYYHAHAYAALGLRQFELRTSIPTGAVYFNKATGVTTYTVYNPKNEVVTVLVLKDEAVVGSFAAAPRQLTAVTKLNPPMH